MSLPGRPEIPHSLEAEVRETIEAQVMQRPELSWRMGLVADRSRNRITEFNSSCFSRDVIAYICNNETLGTMYGFKFIGSTDDLLQAVRDLPKCSPYLHVPVQSGSNDVLKRMKQLGANI